MVKRDKIRTVRAFLRWEPLLTEAQREDLSALPAPRRLCGRRVPASIDMLTFEELARLWEISTPEDLLVVGSSVVLGRRITRRRCLSSRRVLAWIGFANWLGGEIARVTEAWSSIPSSRRPEEVAAGVDGLQFGIFGVVDWYARRMGITDHDAAMKTPWVRIYQCMRNDAETAAYRERLENIIRNKNK